MADNPLTVAITGGTEPLLEERRAMLTALLAGLDRAGIAYVVLSGLDEYPNSIDSDIDLMVSSCDLQKLGVLLREQSLVPGARLVQKLDHETSSSYFVIARTTGVEIAFLHPDASCVYRREGRLWLDSVALLSDRRFDLRGFFVPVAHAAFEYYLIKRIDKGVVEELHFNRLRRLFLEDSRGATDVLARRLHTHALELARLFASGDFQGFSDRLPQLPGLLRSGANLEPSHLRALAKIRDLRRYIRRVLHPTGLVVAVLGPDGSGKTTVIDHIATTFAPAFRRGLRFHLWPRFRQGFAATVTDPHGQPPRGFLGSLCKLGYNLIYYWLGWLALIVPAKIRSTLVIFDRYADDMAIDYRRYRLPAGFFPARLMAYLSPRPDLWLVLQASPEQLVERKGEVSLEAARSLVTGYEMFARGRPHAVLIDTAHSLEQTLVQVNEVLLDLLCERAGRRCGDD